MDDPQITPIKKSNGDTIVQLNVKVRREFREAAIRLAQQRGCTLAELVERAVKEFAARGGHA